MTHSTKGPDRAPIPARGLYFIRHRHTGAFAESALAPDQPISFSRADMAHEFIRRVGDPMLRVVLIQPIEADDLSIWEDQAAKAV